MAACGRYMNFDREWCYIDCNNMLRKGREIQEVNIDGSEILSHIYLDYLGYEIDPSTVTEATCPASPNPVYNMGGKVDIASAPLMEKICYTLKNDPSGKILEGFALLGVKTPKGECEERTYAPYWAIFTFDMCEVELCNVKIVNCPKYINAVSKCVKLADGTTTWANVIVGVGMSTTTVIRIEDDLGNIIDGEIADDCDCKCEEDCP